ncbi:hypothetical protein [Flammeovirga sp. SJP92]|uniref:hypothetical protein n=1 Tax=Flammeovirga sp. SJP92 TaxID=1775430 RepID=UPI0007897A8F|nr:hypothetical protein [Flammeovirga sp. SJP92]KXX70337.1 hypothetical protein AVL50_12075 [Flammeovirga sp. SJP92]
MYKNLLLAIVATILFSCGTELENPINNVPDNSNYIYTSHVKYYKVPGGEPDAEQDFSGYLSMSISEVSGTGRIEIQPEYGVDWTLSMDDLNTIASDSNLFVIPEQNVSINGDNFSVVGMEVHKHNNTVYHVLQTADSVFIKYNSFYLGSTSDYKYTEGEIKGRRFR